MLLFVSGRCDIPAFYTTWFMNRIQAGFVDVRNPYNEHQISRIPLTKENVDCIIFCTKNPLPIMPYLTQIPFPYIFHITLTPYKTDIERNVYHKPEILEGIRTMAQQLGKKRVIVRYDPILISDTYRVEYHIKAFQHLCEQLEGYVETIIISFVDMYKNTRTNMSIMRMLPLHEEAIQELAKAFGKCGLKHNIHIQTCAEDIDLSAFHITKGNCIDRQSLEEYVGYPLVLKGKSIRKECDCLPTVDIGDYNCCAHECLYCYANYDALKVQERMKQHDPNSSVLIGSISEEDHIVERSEKRVQQLHLL